MSCRIFYTPEHRCEAVRAHVHGICSVCGEPAITYRSRWTHVGEPCAPRREGKWVALHGDTAPRFVVARPERTAA